MPLVVIWVCLCVVWSKGYGVIAMCLVGCVWCELKINLKSVCLVAFGCVWLWELGTVLFKAKLKLLWTMHDIGVSNEVILPGEQYVD